MNNFEKTFFKKYIPEWSKIKGIIHEHWIKIINKLLIWLILLTFIPSFLMYNSLFLQEKIPFMYFEIYLIIIFLKIIYDIFDWYNDVWIITEDGIIDLDWSFLKVSSVSVKYENIEWIWVEQNWIIDKILNKWDIIIHKVWDDTFKLVDAKVPYKALNEIENFSNEIKENAQAEKDEFERTRFDLIIESLWWVVDKYLDEKSLNWTNTIKRNQKKSKKENFSEEIILEEWTIDLR